MTINSKIQYILQFSCVCSQFHTIGLKLGLYISLGARSRDGYPGLQGHEGQDVGAILSWGVDFLYVDGYGVDTKLIDIGNTIHI